MNNVLICQCGALEIWYKNNVTNSRNFLHDLPARSQRLPVFIQETVSQCLQHPQTRIIGGASAKSDNKIAATALQRIFNDPTRTRGRETLHGFH